MDSNNKFSPELATRKISGKLLEKCKILWIPNTYFLGYFPQLAARQRMPEKTPKRFPLADRYIDETMSASQMNPDIEAFLDKLSSPDFIPKKTIQDKVEQSIAELRRREYFCEVKIADYVEDNIFGNRLFYSQNHPTPQVLMEVARRILRAIGMRSDNFFQYRELIDWTNVNFSLIGQDIPLYPSVTKFFDIRNERYVYFANRGLWDFHGNFREFQREYIKQWWADKFEE